MNCIMEIYIKDSGIKGWDMVGEYSNIRMEHIMKDGLIRIETMFMEGWFMKMVHIMRVFNIDNHRIVHIK